MLAIIKRVICLLSLAVPALTVSAQERGGMVVNKYRHRPLLLNTYAKAMNNTVENVVSAAYSIRRINLFYTGPLIKVRVRKSSAWYDYDIGYTQTNELDTADLISSVGARDAYIIKWYDQSGNGKDVVAPSITVTSRMPRIAVAGVIDRKGVNKRPSITFQDNTQELYYISGSATVQVVNAVRDLAGNGYQYLFSLPADADFSVRANSLYSALTGTGGYSDGPNSEDWWFGGSMYVNGAAISGMSSGAVKALHNLTSIASSVKSGTFSISNTSSGAWSERGMYNGDGVCEMILFPALGGMAANRTTIENNQKVYYGTP